MTVKVLAPDLERTLVDDALSGRPRPGLRDFLAFCGDRFRRVAVFTTVEEADARVVVQDLADRGLVPERLLARLEYVTWTGTHKSLEFVPGASSDEVLLVDDDPRWVRPDQRGQWVEIAPWDGGPDGELARVRTVLEDWLGDR